VEAEAGAVATSLFHHYFFGNIIICNFAVKLAGFPTCLAEYRTQFEHPSRVCFRDVKAEAEAGSGNGGSGSAEILRFRFHIGYFTWRVTWRKSFVYFPMWIKR